MVRTRLFFMILGLGVGGGSLLGTGCASPRSSIHGSLQEMVWAAGMDHAALGEYPKSLEEVRTVSVELRTDPWGRPYVYRIVDGCPVAICYGEDGKPGGFGENADRVWSVERLELPPEVSARERAWYVRWGTGHVPIPFRAR